jgi:hypothetical protein
MRSPEISNPIKTADFKRETGEKLPLPQKRSRRVKWAGYIGGAQPEHAAGPCHGDVGAVTWRALTLGPAMESSVRQCEVAAPVRFGLGRSWARKLDGLIF